MDKKEFDTLVKRIEELKELFPDKTAVVFGSEQLSYKQLYMKMKGISNILIKKGISPGDRIAFSAVSRPVMAALYLAIQNCNAVAVFLDKKSTPENIRKIYDESGSKLLLTHQEMGEFGEGCNIMTLKEIYEKADEEKEAENKTYHFPAKDDLAEILFTTGTTGIPKGVMLSYKAVYNILSNTIEGLSLCQDEVLLLPLPLNHSFALRVLRATLYRGATVILQEGFAFAREIANNIKKFNCTAMACVPVSYEIMRSQMKERFSEILGDLRLIEFGAGSLSVRQRKEITQLLPNVEIYNTWGSSETGGAIFCNVSEIVKNDAYSGTLGKPLEGKVQIRILDVEGNVIDSDEAHPGRMALKGDMQMSGYWNNEQATKETLKNGWLITGDVAYLKDGYVFMLGRADDIINVGGKKVSPVEIENIACQYEYVTECACIGVADDKGIYEQVPALAFVTKEGYSEEAFLKHLSQKMEHYKMPQKFMKISEFPRNRSYKIDRRALKELWDNNTDIELLNPVVETILRRRSIRKFDNRDIPKNILSMILKCGYYAPNGRNAQSWQFTVLTKEEDILRLKEAAKETARNNKVFFYGFKNPKAIILVSNAADNPDGCQDASCAAENIMLAAQSYGIGSVWLNPLMTLRNVEPVKSVLDEFGIPKGHNVWSAVALGYPAEDITTSNVQRKSDVVRFI